MQTELPIPLESLKSHWKASDDSSKGVQEMYKHRCQELLLRNQALLPSFLEWVYQEDGGRKGEAVKMLKGLGRSDNSFFPETLDALAALGKRSPELREDVLRIVAGRKMILEHRALFIDLLRSSTEQNQTANSVPHDSAKLSGVETHAA